MVLFADVLCDGVACLSVCAALSCAGEGYIAVSFAGALSENAVIIGMTYGRNCNSRVDIVTVSAGDDKLSFGCASCRGFGVYHVFVVAVFGNVQ